MRIAVPHLDRPGRGRRVRAAEDCGRRVARAVAGSLLTTIPAVPHAASLTHHEQWNCLVLEFLTR
ncbi:hypothetical protein GCM10020220_103900 [Nonomuraea rubra]